MQWLTKSALVGTSKSPPPAVAADDPADQLVAKIKGDDRESELLLRAGVHAIAAISGAMPAAATAPPAPAPEEDSPPCSDKLVSLLQNLFAAEQKDLFPEFLSQLTAGGLLLPPELLPPALDIADPKIRTRLLPVLGKRGVWLSQFNPAWSWVTAGAGELSADDRNALKTTWEEGNIALRCQVLGRLRTADPPTAREWLEETFKSEKAAIGCWRNWARDSGTRTKNSWNFASATAASLSAIQRPHCYLALLVQNSGRE